MSLTLVDVVIVGAGPSGLACAYALSGLSVLILERDSRHGGRIHTLNLAGQSVDMGACFAFDPTIVPSGLVVSAGRLATERAQLGVCSNGSMNYGSTPLDCLQGMQLDTELRRQISRFAHTDADAATLVSSGAYALMNALLHQIHPGELSEYDGAHQRDGLYTWYPDHWENGNRPLVDALLNQSGAQLLLNAEVCDIEENVNAVEVSYRTAGTLRQVKCRAAVIAATADVAASLLQSHDVPCRPLLDATRYASYVVVAIAGVQSAGIAEFRCLVSVDGSLAVVMQQRAFDHDSAVLLCYYCGSAIQALNSKTDEELVALTWRELTALGIGKDALNSRIESSVKRWATAGTILSAQYCSCRGDAWAKVSNRLFLAGDYVSTVQGIGYGVADAIASGVEAARQLHSTLNR